MAFTLKSTVPPEDQPREGEIKVGDVYYHNRLRVKMEVVGWTGGGRLQTKLLENTPGGTRLAGSTYYPARIWLRVLNPYGNLDCGEDPGC